MRSIQKTRVLSSAFNWRGAVLGTIGAVATGVWLPGGSTAASGLPMVLDLPAQAAIQLSLPASAVAPAGDVNGDGYADLIAGVPSEADDPTGFLARGGAYVVFGGPGLSSHLTRAELLARAVRIRGRTVTESDRDGEVGAHVTGIGDVNGDGLDDVAVAAPDEEALFRKAPSGIKVQVTGVTYVVYGRRAAGEVDLGELAATDGFAIRGAGDAVASVGDVNADGQRDLAVSAGYDGSDEGRVYVLLGGKLGPVADVEKLGSRAWRIDGAPGDLYFSVIAGVGDLNGDGIADFALGAPQSLGQPVGEFDREPEGPGAAYVVFGRQDTKRLSLDKLGETGITVRTKDFLHLGTGIAAPGDTHPGHLLGRPRQRPRLHTQRRPRHRRLRPRPRHRSCRRHRPTQALREGQLRQPVLAAAGDYSWPKPKTRHATPPMPSSAPYTMTRPRPHRIAP